MSPLNEDTLVQQTTADYLQDALGWKSIYAYKSETFGPDGTLGRSNDKEIVLVRHLKAALVKFNPDLPEGAYQDALRQLTEAPATQSLIQTNQEKHGLIKNGVDVRFKNEKGELEKRRLKVIDFDHPEKNEFLAVRELWIKGSIYRRRADVVGFINGLPLLFMELKNIHRNLQRAYDENFCDYRDVVPHLFHHNAIVLIGNGLKAKIGSITSKFSHFHEWKRLKEKDPGVVDMETLLKGVCNKETLLDIIENFILFDDSSGKVAKIVAKNHQYLGVNQAIEAVKNRKALLGKLGVFWHTQGSGKSYSIAFFAYKIRQKLGGNFTFVILTDRDDLDTQIYKTFAGCGLVNNDKDRCRAGSGEDLEKLLRQHKAFVFTLIQKFNKDVDPDNPYSDRDDIIVISDEAHRSQYGRLSLNMRNALKNASFIGFTGTPLFSNDEQTRKTFGNYVSTYDFQRAVEDNATVPLYYDARGEKLGIATTELNEKIAEKLEQLELEDINIANQLEKELKREYHIVTAQKRLKQIAKDFVIHYSTQWENGKAMLVCIDKITCGKMHKYISIGWKIRIKNLERDLTKITDEQELIYRQRQLAWMKETIVALVVSEEQGEVEKFRKEKIDILPHRKLIKEGFETFDGRRMDMETAFKKPDHPFRVAIVCAMWLTGFDVPSMSTLYLDKPLKAHTLMQAIARANRVNEGKNNGLVVDYCGILKNLRKALATFAGHQGNEAIDGNTPQPEVDPVKPDEELLADLDEAMALIKGFLQERGFRLQDIIEKSGFERNKSIESAKNRINQNDETRKHFEIMAREVFKKFKACITIKAVNSYRQLYDAINIIYKSLQEDREKADISDILRELRAIVDDAIQVNQGEAPDDTRYDISKINFDRLRQEFERSPRQNTLTQNLRDAIEKKLNRMVMENPLRTNFQAHYETIVAEYNQEKDSVTIEKTFQALMEFVDALDEESKRAIREGFEDQETLTLYDLLWKPDLSKKDIERIKKVAKELLNILKTEKLKIDSWWEKESTRDEVKGTIKDFLWADSTGLPVDSYTDEEIDEKTDSVFSYLIQHTQAA